jgi:ribonuclease HI
MQNWCLNWGFKISPTKTVAILFSNTRKHTVKIYLEQIQIPVVKEVKFLGVIFDSKLNWSNHINYIVDKCKRRLNILKSVSSQTWGASKKTLLVIYRGLIRSIIDYGSTAYSTASLSQLAKINRIKNTALRICLAVPKSTQIDSLEVECGEPPLSLRRLELACRHALKIKYHPNHPSISTLHEDWTIHYGRFNTANQPFQVRVGEFLNSINQHQIYPVLSASSLPPWQLRAFQVDTSLTSIGKKNENPILLHSLSLQCIHSYSDHIPIYTDASKHPNGKAGIGLYSPILSDNTTDHKETNISLRIPDNHSIYTAEMSAILFALQTIVTLESQTTKPLKFVIFSDSLSSLKSLQSGHSKSHPYLLQQINKYHSVSKSHIKLVWVPSHISISGNERADILANQATSRDSIDLDIKFEISDLLNNLRYFINTKWQEGWNSKHYFLNTVQPIVSRKIQFSFNDRSFETFTARFRLGYLRLNHFLYKRRLHETGHCDSCGVPETINHFLFDCNNEIAKNLTQWCHQSGINPSIHDILNSVTVIHKIYKHAARKL